MLFYASSAQVVHKNSKLALHWKIGSIPTPELRVVPHLCAHLPAGRFSTCSDRCDRRSDKTKCSSNIVDGWLTRCLHPGEAGSHQLADQCEEQLLLTQHGPEHLCDAVHARMSPKSRPSLYIFSHLARGLKIPLRSAAARFPPLPSYPFRERSPHFQSKASGNQGNQR